MITLRGCVLKPDSVHRVYTDGLQSAFRCFQTRPEEQKVSTLCSVHAGGSDESLLTFFLSPPQVSQT